ncbi:MAG: hypothetical protein ACUVV0_00435 [Anaerolineae bacterium]
MVFLKIEEAQRELDKLVAGLGPGETIALTTAEGEPRALIIGLAPGKIVGKDADPWEMLDALGQAIDRAWISDKTAVELIREGRR